MLSFIHILWLLFFVYFLHLFFLCILLFYHCFLFLFCSYFVLVHFLYFVFLLNIHFSFSIFVFYYIPCLLYIFSFSFSLFITQFYFIIHHSPDKLDCVFSYRFNLHKEICVETCLFSSLSFFAYFLCASYFHILLLQYPFWQW